MKVFQIEDLPIESRMLTDALTEAQRKVEAYFFGEAPFASAAAKARYSSMQRLEAALWQLWLCLLCLLCSRIEMSNRSQKQRMCYGYLILGTRKEGSEVGAPCADIRKQLWEYDQVAEHAARQGLPGPPQGPGQPRPVPAPGGVR